MWLFKKHFSTILLVITTNYDKDEPNFKKSGFLIRKGNQSFCQNSVLYERILSERRDEHVFPVEYNMKLCWFEK